MIDQWIQSDLWGMYQQITSAAPEPIQTLAADPRLGWAQSAH